MVGANSGFAVAPQHAAAYNHSQQTSGAGGTAGAGGNTGVPPVPFSPQMMQQNHDTGNQYSHSAAGGASSTTNPSSVFGQAQSSTMNATGPTKYGTGNSGFAVAPKHAAAYNRSQQNFGAGGTAGAGGNTGVPPVPFPQQMMQQNHDAGNQYPHAAAGGASSTPSSSSVFGQAQSSINATGTTKYGTGGGGGGDQEWRSRYLIAPPPKKSNRRGSAERTVAGAPAAASSMEGITGTSDPVQVKALSKIARTGRAYVFNLGTK